MDDQWDEVVEVSLDVAETSAALTSFDDHHPLTLPAVGPHRLRYSVARFEAGRQIDTARNGVGARSFAGRRSVVSGDGSASSPGARA